MKKISPLPNHKVIIMDGNGRWAERHGLPRLNGHKAGTDNVYHMRRVEILDAVRHLIAGSISPEDIDELTKYCYPITIGKGALVACKQEPHA